MAEIFVSYTSSDRNWAFWLGKELEALGHSPHIHEWEINSGHDIYAWMEQRIDTADHVLCVISDEYLRAPYSTLERNGALWKAAKQPGFALFVAVKPTKLPALSDHILRLELFGIPEEAARHRFREFMLKREAPTLVAFPGSVFALSNVPIRVPEHFLGRDESLLAIDAALKHQDRHLVALHGLRGVGKTTLAAAYAERRRSDTRATWWIRAQTEATMRADLVALGVRLAWVAPDEKEEPALSTIMERLRNEGEGILLIYDNATDADGLKPHLPPGGAAQILITSNAQAWRGVATPIEVRLWPREVGADYLIARTGRTLERSAAETLSDVLGGLPLAHEQAAAYCEDLGIGLVEYRGRFEEATITFLDHKEYVPAEYHPEHITERRERLTVAGTFRLAIEQAAKRHPAAEPLIAHASLLPAEPIPLFLFAEARQKFNERLASDLAGDGLDRAVAALRAFALVGRETIPDEREPAIVTDCIRLHRLVRRVAQTRLEGERREAAWRSLVEATVATYPEEAFNNPKAWPRARRLDALALALIENDAIPNGAEERIGDLLDLLGTYKHGALADYTQARQLKERALAIREKVLGPDHPDTAKSLNALALLLWNQGDLAGSRPLQERALAIRERVFGPNHPDTAMSLNNLALLQRDEGHANEALLLYKRALRIYEATCGPDHPDTALTLNNLAQLLHAQGELEQSQVLYERALAIFENAAGGEHPNTNRARRNFARLLLAQDDPARALGFGEAALTAHDKMLGPHHPWTKDSAEITAEALDRLGRREEADGLRRRYGL